jgi:signal transduction histidine kinase
MIREALITLMESHKDPVVIRNLDGEVIMANRAAHKFYGSWEKLPSAKMPESDWILYQETMKEGTVRHLTGIRLKENGDPIEVDLDLISILSEGGNTIGWAEIIRLAELDLERLGPAALVMAAAHDLRSPLSILTNLLYLMQQKVEEKHLEMMRKQLLVCESIVDNFLEFSSRRAPRIKQMNLNSLIADTLSILPLHPEVTVNMQEEAHISITADPGQVRQVILNLLQNALEALGGRRGSIWIRVSRDENTVRLDITDSGVGIARQHLPRVFQPFFSTKERGFGLGLASCKQIVEAHGGTIQVNSSQGVGTTFSIFLPIR